MFTVTSKLGDKTMQGLKGVIVVATIVATAAALGACRKQVVATPMKLGAADTAVELPVRV